MDGAEADFVVPRARRILIPQPAEGKFEKKESQQRETEKKREKAGTYHIKVASWPQ